MRFWPALPLRIITPWMGLVGVVMRRQKLVYCGAEGVVEVVEEMGEGEGVVVTTTYMAAIC